MTTIFQRAIVFATRNPCVNKLIAVMAFKIPRAKKDTEWVPLSNVVTSNACTKDTTHLKSLLVKSRRKDFGFPTFKWANTSFFTGNEVIIASSRQGLHKGMTLD